MASYALRLRRAIPLSSSLLSHTLYKPNLNRSTFQTNSASEFHRFDSLFQSRLFRSSTVSLSSRSRSFDRNAADDEIGPDTILFEGCDYEHWLITVDFPKDVQLTREEKIETYIQTAAKVFGSVEEAKKKIYALSTTTYEGFQVLCSEDTSKKFEGLPGVVFVLPDSYIDPVNKEYGGDKYINGEIIERPPPPQFRRESRPPRRGPQYQRSNYGPPQQNYGAPPPQQNYGAPSPQQNYAPSQQNYGAPQGSPPQQNYGAPQGSPPQQNLGALQGPPPQQNYGTPQGSPSQQNYGAPQGPPPKQNSGPPRHQNYGPQQYPLPPQENRPPQQNYGHPLQSYGAPQQSFSPQQNYGPQGDHRGPTPLGSSQGGWGSSPQGDRQGSRPPYQENYNRAEQGNYFPQRDNQQYAPPQRGSYGQGPIGGQVQGTDPTFGLNNPRQGEDQSFPRMEQTENTIMQGGEQRTFATNGMDQGRY